MQVRFVDVEGVRTRVLMAGSGSPLVLVHGVGLTADTWALNIDALGREHTVIAPDLLGHGFTDAVTYTRAPQLQMAQHLVAVAGVLGAQSFSLAGSSFGGLVAALVALEHRSVVERLILVGSGSVFHTPDTRVRSLRAAFENGRQAMQSPSVESCRERLANICYERTAVPESILLAQATAYAAADRLEAYRATIDAAVASVGERQAQAFERLEDIDLPTLVITGQDDIRASVEQTRTGIARMPQARLVGYERCNPLPYVEYPERFNADVLEFRR